MSVPKLRFKEFQEDWKKKTVESISSTVTSGSRDWAQYYSETGDKFIRMTNLVREGINLDLSDLRFVSLPVDSSSEGKRTSLIFGDILVSITAELGKLGWVPNNFGTAYINQHTALIRPSSKVHSKFIAYTLSTKKYNNDLNSLNDSGAKAGLNLSTLKSFSISLPENLTEQTKIATFLSAVDEKIAQLSRKHELLQQYKQGMMQQLFSQKLRFKDDKGEDFPEWEEKLLGNICSNFQSGKSITSDEIFEVGKYPVYGGNGLRGFTSSYTHEGTFVLIGRQGALCGNINLVNQKNFVSEHAIAVQAQKSFSNEWLAQLLTWMNLGRFSESSAQAGLAVNKLIKFKICCPTKLEQTKIANFLNAIDNKIDVITNQIQQAREWKQGLLQQMFV